MPMSRRNQPEAQLQRAIVQHLRWRARPNTWWTHIPTGGWRSPVEAKIFKSLGVVAGAPDLLIVADGHAHFLELKSPRGRISPAQHECHQALRAAGATVAVADDIDQALELLTTWGLLRSDISNQIATTFAELRDNGRA